MTPRRYVPESFTVGVDGTLYCRTCYGIRDRKTGQWLTKSDTDRLVFCNRDLAEQYLSETGLAYVHLPLA